MASIERKYFHLYNNTVRIEFLPHSHRYYLLQNDDEILAHKKTLPGVSTIVGKLDKSQALMGYVAKVNAEKAHDLSSQKFLPIYEIIEQSKKAYLEKTHKAQDKGTIIHRFMDEYSRDQNEKKSFDRTLAWIKKEYKEQPKQEVMKQVRIGAKGFITWVKKQKQIEFIDTEKIVYSKKHIYVGQYDAKIKLNGEILNADYKTSKDIYPSHLYQVAGYDIADTEEHGNQSDGTIVISVSTEDKKNSTGEIIQKAGTVNVMIRKGKELNKDKKLFLSLLKLYSLNKEVEKELRVSINIL